MDLIEKILTSKYRFFEKIQSFKSLKKYKYFSFFEKYKYFSNDFIFRELKGNLYNSIKRPKAINRTPLY
jgi:hypothetical protein